MMGGKKGENNEFWETKALWSEPCTDSVLGTQHVTRHLGQTRLKQDSTCAIRRPVHSRGGA